MNKTEEKKKFIVYELGMGEVPVSRDNAVFGFCVELDKVDKLEVNQYEFVKFQTGAGVTVSKVTRVE